MPYTEPFPQPSPKNNLQKVSNGCMQNVYNTFGKAAELQCFLSPLPPHEIKGSRDLEAQHICALAALAVQVSTLISHCMLKSLPGCYFLLEGTPS